MMILTCKFMHNKSVGGERTFNKNSGLYISVLAKCKSISSDLKICQGV